MSMEMMNRIREVEGRMEDIRLELKDLLDEVHERMDRIEFRKKPGPKPRRLQEKMNDQ
jgi:hypothetical protein